METFSWKKTYCVGDETIDSQHQRLFELANDLIESRNKYYLGINVGRLHDYCREHFGNEEGAMRKCAYPGIEGHLAMHDMLMTRLNAISEGVREDKWSREDLVKFMNEWLLGHILAEDTKLVKFLKKSNWFWN